jgi:hypothetical protein
MKIDYIVKEELWRSIPVYFVSFLVIGGAITGFSLPVPLSFTFWLALIPAALHFLFMVGYRRKENLTDPTVTNIIRHAFGSEKADGKETDEK